jgi:hypothetical protein
MAAGDKEGPGLPTSGLITALVLLASAIVVHQLPYIVSRPSLSDPAWRPFVARQDVDARLWQDPFAAVTQHIEQAQSRARGSEVDRAELDRHSADSMATGLRRDLSKTVLMPVMLPGGRHGEDIEGRRRTRYAVVAGLSRLGFTPDDAERIGFFRSKAPTDVGFFGSFQSKPSTGGLELPGIVPWELFKKKRASTPETGADEVLVLWLDASAFGERPPRGPLSKLERLLADLGLCQPGLRDGARVVMIGPASSDDLQPLKEDAKEPERVCLTGMSIYSPWATAALEPNENPEAKPNLPKIQFTRMIGTDKSLMPAVKLELKRRGIKPPLDKHAVAVVYEFDTRYGRDIVDVARRKLCWPRRDDADCVYAVGYLRGIDGKIPRRSEPKDAAGDAKAPGGQPAAPSGEDLERAEGDSQFDYLRRLAARMRSEHDRLVRDGLLGIKAVGVFGSDLYDKLLVLQAVRQEFPTAVFFTTDLDARYMHPREFQWTRNLIVASSFGLQLREDIQEDLPPFRNNYQTATFLAAIVGVVNAAPGRQGAISQETIQRWLKEPHVYEIGRTESVDVTEGPAGPQEARGGVCKSLVDCPNVYPEPVFFDWPYRKTLTYGALGILLAVILVPLVSSNVRRGVIKTARWCRLHLLIALLILLGLVILIGLFVLGVVCEGRRGEPFRFFEGVSMWPTEILRVLSFCVAIIGIVMTDIRRARTEEKLQRYFEPPASPGPERPHVAELAGEALAAVPLVGRAFAHRFFPGYVPAPDGRSTWGRVFAGKPGRGYFSLQTHVATQELWLEHCYQNAPAARWTRILVGSVLFFFLGGSVLVALGLPVTPARGEFSWVVDRIVILFNAVALIILIFCIGDTIKLCDKFAYCLAAPLKNRWPKTTRQYFGIKQVDQDTPLDTWIDVRFLAEWTGRIGSIIYYPFVVLFVIVVGRSSIFDNWDMPPGLVAVLFLSLGVASATVFILRRAAERLRRVSVERLTKELVIEEGLSPEAPTVKQLRTVLGEIRELKQGAFAPITSQPLVRAALLPLSGAGGIALLEYFFLHR